MIEERKVFDEHYVDFSELRCGVLLEYLGEDSVRVAFRVAEPAHEAEVISRAVPASACGYPVDADAWGRAVLEAGLTLRDELIALGHDVPGDKGKFDPLLADLRAHLPDR